MNSFVSLVVYCNSNAEQTQRCLESILLQSHSEFELLLFDPYFDQRPQQKELSETLKDQRIKHVPIDWSATIGEAYNLGLSHCRGAYVCFLTTSCLLSANGLAKQIRTTERLPAKTITYSAIEILREDGSPTNRVIDTELQQNAIGNLLFSRNALVQRSAMASRWWLEKYGITFEEEQQVDHSWLWLMNCVSSGAQFEKIETPLLKYQPQVKSLSISKSLIDRVRTLATARSYLNKESVTPVFRSLIKSLL